MRTILVAGSIALGAEDRWMKTREGELRKRFPSFFAYAQRHSPQRVGWDQVRQAVEAHGSWTDPVRSGALGCLRELASARRSHPPLIRPSDGTVFLPMGRDGFFAALWALNELCGCGCDIDLEAVPVRQETIEFCEYFGADPYGEDSSGAVMLAARASSGAAAGSAVWTVRRDGEPPLRRIRKPWEAGPRMKRGPLPRAFFAVRRDPA